MRNIEPMGTKKGKNEYFETYENDMDYEVVERKKETPRKQKFSEPGGKKPQWRAERKMLKKFKQSYR